ncbi:NnrS family protein [Tropicibacter sp. S64]|uniref:NnrS family protein n=1 Tax=Tropicibacter sp. S64 TaxID=3415122 RepID=UPI003C7D6D1F
MKPRASYRGPDLFSYGFRPFFLSATLFALVVVPLWWLVWRGRVALESPFVPTDWHVHEMIFGYGAAVVAGFLFTAVPNWTGRLPTRGWPLAALLAVWVAGRLVVAGLAGLPPLAVLAIDQAFLLAVATMITREIVAGKNWRNLKVLVPVSLLWLSNILFHLESMSQGYAAHGQRLGISLLIFLVLMIGGRIIPSFTRNWLAKQTAAKLPVPFGRFDGLAVGFAAAALLVWVLAPTSWTTIALAAGAGLLHAVRLSRWCGLSCRRSPLLLMLHAAYAFVPLGFACVAADGLGWLAPAVGVHVLGIGAIGGMTVAVMMRATMGHTGRDLIAGRGLTVAFALLVGAVGLRVAGASLTLAGQNGIDLAAVLWTLGFAIIALRIGPWLLRPRVAAKMPSQAV